jgi:hypothetical protein
VRQEALRAPAEQEVVLVLLVQEETPVSEVEVQTSEAWEVRARPAEQEELFTPEDL